MGFLIFLRFCSLFLAWISSVTQFITLWCLIPLSAGIFKVHPKDQWWKFLLELSQIPIYLLFSITTLSLAIVERSKVMGIVCKNSSSCSQAISTFACAQSWLCLHKDDKKFLIYFRALVAQAAKKINA